MSGSPPRLSSLPSFTIPDFSRDNNRTVAQPIRFGLAYGDSWTNDDGTPVDYFRWWDQAGCKCHLSIPYPLIRPLPYPTTVFQAEFPLRSPVETCAPLSSSPERPAIPILPTGLWPRTATHCPSSAKRTPLRPTMAPKKSLFRLPSYSLMHLII